MLSASCCHRALQSCIKLTAALVTPGEKCQSAGAARGFVKTCISMAGSCCVFPRGGEQGGHSELGGVQLQRWFLWWIAVSLCSQQVLNAVSVFLDERFL